MTPLSKSLCLSSLALLILISPEANADKITLSSGRVMEGKVIEEKDGYVVIKTDKGITARFKAELIKSIEKAASPLERYEAMKAKAKTASDHLELARYCAKQNMKKEEEQHYKKVLELNPNQREARDKLGYAWNGQAWISRSNYMKDLGLVKYKGRWVSEAEKDLLVTRAEARKNRGKVRRLIWEAVKHKSLERQMKAREKLKGMSDLALVQPYRSALVLASQKERAFVIDSISSRVNSKKVFNKMLSRSVLAEPKRSIRHAALDALESKKDPNAALYFTSALSSESPILRINAANALMRFPDTRSIAPLIVTLRYETGDFGRAHVVNFTQRAYIRDFELSSGGTGLAIAEVADPVIDTFTEGTVLDVKVRKVEWYSKAAVLSHLTGADFGIKQVAWKNWYKKNKGQLALSPKAKKRRDAYLASKN